MGETDRYRVEAVHWEGGAEGADDFADLLNGWAEQGWELVSVTPTRADTSIRALRGAGASADTTEFAVVLRRTR